MDFGSLLLLLALVIIVAAFVASPLRHAPKREAVGEDDIELSQLLAERERVLDALAELDFDAEMGKVPDDLYPLQREALLKRGVAVLQLLDARVEENESDEAERAARLERAASIRSPGRKRDSPGWQGALLPKLRHGLAARRPVLFGLRT